MDSVVGIDLSGLTSGSRGWTVAAHLFLDTPPRLGEPLRVPRGLSGDRVLVEWIEERKPSVIAIDAPLTLPHCVTCADANCPRCEPGTASYLERDVDTAARRLGGGMPTVMLAAIAFRGIWLAKVLRRSGIDVIETYPAAVYRQLGALGKTHEERAELLAQRIGQFTWATGDQVDAVCAAVVAADYAAGPHDGVIRGEDGEIWVSRA